MDGQGGKGAGGVVPPGCEAVGNREIVIRIMGSRLYGCARVCARDGRPAGVGWADVEAPGEGWNVGRTNVGANGEVPPDP